MFGPTLGFLLGSFCASLWVDVGAVDVGMGPMWVSWHRGGGTWGQQGFGCGNLHAKEHLTSSLLQKQGLSRELFLSNIGILKSDVVVWLE